MSSIHSPLIFNHSDLIFRLSAFHQSPNMKEKGRSRAIFADKNGNSVSTLQPPSPNSGKSVGSFGEGPGEYIRLLMATGTLKSYTGYDGSPYAHENSEGRVQYLDLTIDAYGLPAFDWVFSLEVAEHIPATFERSVRGGQKSGKSFEATWGGPKSGKISFSLVLVLVGYHRGDNSRLV